MAKAPWLAIAALSLSGCATTIMQGFVGQPVEAAMVRYGPPSAAFDMPDGRRAFQWRMESGVPIPSTTTFQATQIGPLTTGSVQTYGGGMATQVCHYTLYASRAGSSWVIQGYEKPPVSCL